MPCRMIFVYRLNYTKLVIQHTQQLKYIAAHQIFCIPAKSFQSDFVKIVIIFLGDYCFENDFLKILYCCEKQKQKAESSSDEDVRSL